MVLGSEVCSSEMRPNPAWDVQKHPQRKDLPNPLKPVWACPKWQWGPCLGQVMEFSIIYSHWCSTPWLPRGENTGGQHRWEPRRAPTTRWISTPALDLDTVAEAAAPPEITPRPHRRSNALVVRPAFPTRNWLWWGYSQQTPLQHHNAAAPLCLLSTGIQRDARCSSYS